MPCTIFGSKLNAYLCYMTAMQAFVETMNRWGSEGKPFLFVVDFDLKQPFIQPLDALNGQEVLFWMKGFGNAPESWPVPKEKLLFEISPPDFNAYKAAFDRVIWHLRRGDSYLLNLTMAVPVQTNLSLQAIFYLSQSPYKLCFNNNFVVFSPEPFVKIENGIISTHPMKGTLDASLPHAETLLMNDPKELAEHYTIVDLLRNDLNSVSEKVRVDQFRYLDTLETTKGKLMQTSSHISGQLPKDYLNHLGNILQQLLPAGSVTGAPKKKTVELIRAIENYERGFYTGVFGVFDGQKLESAVMIRFLERTIDGFVFKAGGGITIHSSAEKEYEELLRKVYLPFENIHPQ